MPAHAITNAVALEHETVQLADFPKLVERHLRRYSDTPALEIGGSQLRSVDFAEQQLALFIRRVCTWGGYPGIGGRIIKQNSMVKIRGCFRAAMARLELDAPDISGALNEINHICSLGTPSFASKHLRFLRPDICPILDRIVSDRLNYSFTIYGYRELATDCSKIANLLQYNQIINPRHRDENRWYVSDVEMAIFSYLNKL